MRSSSKELLAGISRHCTDRLSDHHDNMQTLLISGKDQSSRVNALYHIRGLTHHYFKQEHTLKKRSHHEIEIQILATAYLHDNDYRHGIIDAIHNIIDELEKE